MLSLSTSIMLGMVVGVHDTRKPLSGASVNACTQAVIAASQETVPFKHAANFVSSQLAKLVTSKYVTVTVVDSANAYMPSKAGIDMLVKLPDAIKRIAETHAYIDAKADMQAAAAAHAAALAEPVKAAGVQAAPAAVVQAEPAKPASQDAIDDFFGDGKAAAKKTIVKTSTVVQVSTPASTPAPVAAKPAKEASLKVKLEIPAYITYTLTKKGIDVENVPKNIDDCILTVLRTKDGLSAGAIADAIIASVAVSLPRSPFKSVINSVMHKTAYNGTLWNKTGSAEKPVWMINPAYKTAQ